MPDSKPISELITAEQTSGSDLFETAIPNAVTETGYISRKVTANALALLFNNTLQFSSQLQTTAKTLIGAINELAQGGGGGGASVAMGTTDPSASSGSNGDLYIKYDGTSYEVLAMFVKISGDWREIETGGGGESQCGAFVDYTDLIATVTFTNGSASYTATTDCYAIIRGYYVNNTTAIQIKVDGVIERGSSRVGSAIELTTFMATSLLLKKGQTLTVENCLSTTNDNYIKIYGLQYSSPNLQPVIYSEDEREIGVWTDGKPLYEKSYLITNTNISTGWNILINNVSNIDTFVWGECALSDSSYGYSWGANYHSNGDIAIYNFLGGDISSASGYVTIRYTKTTDTAGSGKWTPQGVPAVHYSTDEQVVGTWIDGSTIYECSHVFETEILVGGTWVDTPWVVSNIDKILDVEAMTSAGTFWALSAAKNSNNEIRLLSFRTGDNCNTKYLTIRYTKSST